MNITTACCVVAFILAEIVWLPDAATAPFGFGRWKKSEPRSTILRGHTGPVSCCCYSPDGLLLITADQNGFIHFWEGDSGTIVGKVQHAFPILSMDVDRFGKWLAIGDDHGNVMFLDLKYKSQPIWAATRSYKVKPKFWKFGAPPDVKYELVCPFCDRVYPVKANNLDGNFRCSSCRLNLHVCPNSRIEIDIDQ